MMKSSVWDVLWLQLAAGQEARSLNLPPELSSGMSSSSVFWIHVESESICQIRRINAALKKKRKRLFLQGKLIFSWNEWMIYFYYLWSTLFAAKALSCICIKSWCLYIESCRDDILLEANPRSWHRTGSLNKKPMGIFFPLAFGLLLFG